VARSSLVVALALLLVALPLGARGQQQPFDIYITLPLTGQVAFLGSETAQAVRGLQNLVNAHGGIRGRPINFVIADDESNPQVEVQLVSQELAKKPAVIIGGELAAACHAAIGLLNKENGPVYYCLTPAVHPTQDDWYFSAGYSTDALLGTTLRYLRDSGMTKFATLNTTDASGQDGDATIAALLRAPEFKTMSLVDNEHFTVSDISVAAQLARIQSSGAQALIAWDSGTPFTTVMRGIRDAGMKIPVVSSQANLVYRYLDTTKDMLTGAPLLFPGVPPIVPQAVTDRRVHQAIVDFTTALKSQGVDRPDVAAATPWDPMQIVLSAYRTLGFDATPAQVRSYIDGLRDWTGIYGYFNYAVSVGRGAQRQWVMMVRWDSSAGTFAPVSQPGGAPLKS
jgi:branched-chain amino acid transport system substrate-binding protein